MVSLGIDTAEDRSKFSMLCDALGIDQPEWSAFATFEEVAVVVLGFDFIMWSVRHGTSPTE